MRALDATVVAKLRLLRPETRSALLGQLNTVLGRRDLIAFTEYTFPAYKPARHHRLIAAQLERVLAGHVDRLMLLVPPRHGKSELASSRLSISGTIPNDSFCRYRRPRTLPPISGAMSET
jgi:hypothetical protein